ncbi:cingulin isoform X2 [Stigmatopora argus]
MSTLSGDRKPPVDYGVQIRFIKDLHEGGGAPADRSKMASAASPQPASKYGVAVRVQGISGQPYVVLNDGAKGDSYGVQINTPPASVAPSPASYDGAPEFSTSTGPGQAHSPEDEEAGIYRSPLRRPPGDGQAGSHGDEESRNAQPQVKAVADPKLTGKNDEEYNEAGLKPVKVNGGGPRGYKCNGFTGSPSKYVNAKVPESPADPLASAEEKPIDTDSLAPINKLISKFNNRTAGGPPQARGRSAARQQLRFEERKRSKSLDARKEPSTPSPTFNPYASPLASQRSDPELETRQASFASPRRPPPREFPLKKPEIMPRNQKGVGGPEKAQAKQAIYNGPKEGTSENEASLECKTNRGIETISNLKDGKQKALGPEEQLTLCRKQLQRAHDELAEERMGREMAESRLHLQEDHLAELQEELRRFSETSADSPQTDVASLRAELAEATLRLRRQEDMLRQRERELTALKGALKEEVECHDREMETLREQYGVDMCNLRKTMEQLAQSQEQIEEERERVNASLVSLEEELDCCRDRGDQWKSQLDAASQDLRESQEKMGTHSGTHKLLQCQSEKDELESQLKEVQDSLPDVREQRSSAESEALEALKRENGEREARLLAQIDAVKAQKAELEKALSEAKEASSRPSSADHGANLELQESNARLRERIARMRLQSSATRNWEAEEAAEAQEEENRALKSQLEEAKRGASRLAKEREELSRRLGERDLEREALRRSKADLEEQKRLLDRALEKMNKEMEAVMGDSRQSVTSLQSQLDEYRERSRKDLQEAQRNNKDRMAELQRAQANLKTQQDEVSRLKKELLSCSEERDGAQLEQNLLSNRLKHLEGELESQKGTHSDRNREIRGLEDKIKSLEIELDEERSSVELLNDRIARARDQVDQLRSELMQERSARHDLEMDKSAIERQVKELKSRVADMEGQARPSAGMAVLEGKIQELEERLRSEEREKNSIQASQRRTERKLKEVNATLDQERIQHVEQKDQLTLRVKALKRKVDESEGEVERLEGVRRKVLRELEEQQELQEALQAKVTALESEFKRKAQHSHRSALATLSSEDDDAFYDVSVAAILNEAHNQGSNC